MSSLTEFRYRIIYEALSRFSSHLSQCGQLSQVASCLQTDLKFLFDFRLIRFCFYQGGRRVHFSLQLGQCDLEEEGGAYWPHEKMLMATSVPTFFDEDTLHQTGWLTPDMLQVQGISDGWGWNFRFGDTAGVLVSVFSGSGKSFTKNDVPVLKLAVENVYAKILSLMLIAQLDERQAELEGALVNVQQTNEQISHLVEHQEEIIHDRTAEIASKNRKLLEISSLNAHNIREPLSRVMGLVALMDPADPAGAAPMLPMLHQSANDLDTALKSMIHNLDQELKNVFLSAHEKNNAGG